MEQGLLPAARKLRYRTGYLKLATKTLSKSHYNWKAGKEKGLERKGATSKVQPILNKCKASMC